MDKKLFKIQTEQDSWVFGTLHANLMGPMTLEAQWSHAKFSLVIHDDCSNFGFVFNLTHKDHTWKIIINLDKVIEKNLQKRVHTLKTYNSGEFINNELQTYCQDRGITSITSIPHNPELNGLAERCNQTHIEGARTMLKDLVYWNAFVCALRMQGLLCLFWSL